MNISDIYRPITSAPFRNSENYREYSPCKALAPYIRCFWSAHAKPGQHRTPSRVIPDTCTDIIIDIDRESSTYCGINDIPQMSPEEPLGKDNTFAVRFYCHTAVLFSDSGMSGTLNSYYRGEELFGEFTGELTRRIKEAGSICECIKISEDILLKRLDKSRENPGFLNALYYIISHRGIAGVEDIARYTAYSKRQLERIFKEYAGVSPKTLAGLIRYQLLWQDVLSGSFDVLEAVEKYGYCDQSHLLNDFRKFHGLTPRHAFSEAYKDVAFLQDDPKVLM